jgi:Family of unknown function (DUF5715)
MRAFVCAVAVFLFFLPVRAANPQILVASASSQMIQNVRADDDHLSRMRDLKMVRRFVDAGYLVPVPSSARFYYLHSISSRYRYCRPWTRLFLRRLSRQYYARFGTPLRVTSLVRTVARQVRLGQRNGNAADAFGPLRSSHLTGASLDISKHSMSPAGRRWMRHVLYSLKQQGYLYAVEEFEQPTFHVMVYRNYPKYVKSLQEKQNPNLLARSNDGDKDD